MRLLLVDNDSDYLNTYLSGLEKQYIVDIAYNAAEGTYLSEVNDYDVIVVDSSIPDMCPPDLCRCTREIRSHVPILLLADRDNREITIKSLEAGADLFVYKPVDTPELCAQVNALVRRTCGISTSKLHLGALVVDLTLKKVLVHGNPINLRRKEYEILEYLALNAGNTISQEKLLDHVWTDGMSFCSNVLEVHIRNIRKKLERPFGICFIKTVRGFGYKLISGNI